MKIRVDAIRPNPYRNMDKYPIDREKVDALKNSIKETEFWDNLLVRGGVGGDLYELAYGHHRLQAIRELGMEEIDVPVKDIDNATMLRIMANENMDDWKTSPAIINETVSAAKTFIDAELAKYETWDEFYAAKNSIVTILDNERSFLRSKEQGAGRNIITAFLGGNWKAWKVEAALRTLDLDNTGKVDREAVETFRSTESAKTFSAAVETYNVPKEKQKELAKRIVDLGRDSKREVKRAVQREVLKHAEPDEVTIELPKEDREVTSLLKNVRNASHAISVASTDIQEVVNSLEKLNAVNLASIEGMGLRMKVETLVDTLARLAPYLNMTIERKDNDE